MRRREFITLLSGAGAWPLAARAQQSALPVVGILGGGSRDAFGPAISSLVQGLRRIGYVDGRNVAIEYRWANGQYDRLRALVADLVQRRAAVIVTLSGTPTAQAAKAATSTIPIVFVLGSDPVAAGLVRSLSRPGGNLTGVTNLTIELAQKRLEVLHHLVPKVSTSPNHEIELALAQHPTQAHGIAIGDLESHPWISFGEACDDGWNKAFDPGCSAAGKVLC